MASIYTLNMGFTFIQDKSKKTTKSQRFRNRKYCAFVDLLGFKITLDDWIKVLKTFGKFRDVAGFATSASKTKSVWFNGKIEVDILSDAIILTGTDICELLFLCSLIQAHAENHGLWIRGSISFGRHFSIKEYGHNFVLSQALRDAYISESSAARYPRIILDKTALGQLLNDISENSDPMFLSHLVRFLFQADDNQWFVNPYIGYYEDDPRFKTIAKALTKKSPEYVPPVQIEKYIWRADLHNFVILIKDLIVNDRASYYEYYYSPLMHKQYIKKKVRSLSKTKQEEIVTWPIALRAIQYGSALADRHLYYKFYCGRTEVAIVTGIMSKQLSGHIIDSPFSNEFEINCIQPFV